MEPARTESQDARVVHCPLCDLPHRQGALACDRCGQVLGSKVDVAALRDEYERQKQRILIAAIAVVAMIGLNLIVFSGVGVIIVVAPVGWLVRSWARARTLRAWLKKAEG